MIKKALFLVLIVVCLVIINSLVHSIIDLMNKRQIIVQAQKQYIDAKKQNSMLTQQLKQAQSESFIEEEARDKLFMIKPGEQDIIVPIPSITPVTQQTANATPNWEKWIKLFFSS